MSADCSDDLQKRQNGHFIVNILKFFFVNGKYYLQFAIDIPRKVWYNVDKSEWETSCKVNNTQYILYEAAAEKLQFEIKLTEC